MTPTPPGVPTGSGVRSSHPSIPPYHYRVDLDAMTCECLDYANGYHCKHLIAAQINIVQAHQPPGCAVCLISTTPIQTGDLSPAGRPFFIHKENAMQTREYPHVPDELVRWS